VGAWGGAVKTLCAKVIRRGDFGWFCLTTQPTREDTVTPSPNVEGGVSGSSRAVPAAAASASSTSSSAAQSSTSTTSVTSSTTTASSAPRVTTGSAPHLTGSGRTVNPLFGLLTTVPIIN
jgi:hypothetical protein